MISVTHRRWLSWLCRAAFGGWPLVLLLPFSASAQPPLFLEPPHLWLRRGLSPSVEALARDLGALEPGRGQEELLRKRIEALHGITDLVQAFLLEQWRVPVREPGRDPRVVLREKIAERLGNALRDELKRDNPARQAAAMALIIELAEENQQGYGPDQLAISVADRLSPLLVVLADSKDLQVRSAAARSLGAIPSASLSAIRQLLTNDPEVQVRRAVVEGLARRTQLLEWLARGSHQFKGVHRETEKVQEDILSILAEALTANKDRTVRRVCLEVIQRRAEHVPIPELPPQELSPDRRFGKGRVVPDPLSRQLLFFSRIIPAVAGLLKEEDRSLVLQACEVLEAVTATRQHLRAVAADQERSRLPPGTADTDREQPRQPEGDDPIVSQFKKGPLEMLAQLTKHEDIERRLAALYVLEELQQEAAPVVAEVASSMKDADPFVRWAAARVLGKMAPKEAQKAVGALAGCVKDINGDVRITVLAALERYGPEAAPVIKDVRGLLGQGDLATQRWAARVLRAIGPKARLEATPGLLKLLAAENVELRQAAVQALQAFGPADEVSKPALLKALNDSDPTTRRIAWEILLQQESSPK